MKCSGERSEWKTPGAMEPWRGGAVRERLRSERVAAAGVLFEAWRCVGDAGFLAHRPPGPRTTSNIYPETTCVPLTLTNESEDNILARYSLDWKPDLRDTLVTRGKYQMPDNARWT